MNSSNVKSLVTVCVLLVAVSTILCGCGSKSQTGAMVNTGTLPGHTFSQGSGGSSQDNSAVVYLGDDKNSNDVNFGPKDVSFEFRALK